ncbi:hypothetical protein [Streptomyces sp. NBC_01565]|uniref:hypothetical protein n=1 Tax=Streptomyces sp. NBC_01565 TaxID=2975881 RepID=UPI002255FF16|nr:hypothetical protein [Streptomyces sp. NBC_01565]MCX4542697.1 hypothetical protein [Streptomyces sp. NBC_01565]
MDADSFFNITGGRAADEDFPQFIDREAIASYRIAFNFSRAMMSTFDDTTGLRTRVELVNSPFFTCRAKMVGQDEYALAIPLGLVSRLHVLAHLLLGYWQSGQFFKFTTVPQESQKSAWDLPRKLVPLFGATRRSFALQSGLEELYDDVATPEAQPDVLQLTYLALIFAIGHEVAHVHRRHDATLKLLRLKGWVQNARQEQVFRRFAEIDADVMATYWALDSQWTAIKGAQDHGDEQVSISLAYLRISYAVTMLYALFDAHRKQIGAYGTGFYPHPIIRRHIFTTASFRLANISPQSMTEWPEMELTGWAKCVSALSCLNLDVLAGRFGAVQDAARVVPISALHYDSAPELYQSRYDREKFLYSLVLTMHEGIGCFRMAGAPETVSYKLPGLDDQLRMFTADDPELLIALNLALRTVKS